MCRIAYALLAASLCFSQPPAKTASPSIERDASLAERGQCAQTLPRLKQDIVHATDADLKRRVGLAGVKCAMALNRQSDAVYFLNRLQRDFPHDAGVLYLATHVYSDLSVRASQELLATAPSSPEVHELNAEALETQGKWQDAMSEYRAVLAKDPRLKGIHYRIGRLLLSQPETSTSKEEARKEFEAELQVDPNNAGAEFVLGELSRQAEDWPDAIAHFSRATQLDGGFFDAWLGLGRALMGGGKPADAIQPLETAEKMQPQSPIVHFELATAYQRSGRKADAAREFALHKAANANAAALKDRVAKGLGAGPEKP